MGISGQRLNLVSSEALSGLRIAPYSCSKRGAAPRPASYRQYGIGVPPPLVSALSRARPPCPSAPTRSCRRSPYPPSHALRWGIAEGGERNSSKRCGVGGDCDPRRGVLCVGACWAKSVQSAPESTGNGQAVWSSQRSERGRFCRPSPASDEKDAHVPRPRPRPRPSFLVLGIERDRQSPG